MRDYDDYADYNDQNIRLYTPVVQRMIILAAVIIAVPVVMWTITTFVRSYVARPKLPTLEHVASTNMVGRIPAISPPPPISSRAATDQPAPSRNEASAADAPNSAAALPNPAAPVETLPSPATANSPSSAASLQLPALQAPSPAIVASAASTTGDTSTGNAGAAAIAPAPRLGPRSTDSLTSTGAVGSSDRGIPWPNPNTTSPQTSGRRGCRLPPPRHHHALQRPRRSLRMSRSVDKSPCHGSGRPFLPWPAALRCRSLAPARETLPPKPPPLQSLTRLTGPEWTTFASAVNAAPRRFPGAPAHSRPSPAHGRSARRGQHRGFPSSPPAWRLWPALRATPRH